MRRIAVFNTAFLGDAVLTLPLIQTLRLRYPEAAIDFYVRGGLEKLFTPHPALASVFGYDKRGRQKGAAGFASLARNIAARRYDVWISAHASLRSGLLALASRARRRIGYAKPSLNALLYTDRVDRHFCELEEIERLLQLVTPLGAGPVSNWPELALGKDEESAASRFFSALQGPVLGVHPGSVWATKRWPAASFAHVARKALEAGAHVLLFAGKGEGDIARQVKGMACDGLSSALSARLHDLSGGLSLPLLAAYIDRLSCYLTNDSGPMHIAWCRGVPVTALFGPTVRSLGFFPRGAHATVFETDIACRPCGLHGPSVCPLGHHQCMTAISPERVWDDVRAKLAAM